MLATFVYALSLRRARTGNILILGLLIASVFAASAQPQVVDSIRRDMAANPNDDTLKVQQLADLGYYYHYMSPDSTLKFASQAYALAGKLNYEKGKADALKHWAIGAYLLNDFRTAYLKNEASLQLYEKLGDRHGEAAVLNNIAIINHNEGNYQAALDYYNKSLVMRIAIDDQRGIADCYNNIGNTLSDMGRYSEALVSLYRSLKLRERLGEKQSVGNSLSNIANVYYFLGKYDAALAYSLRGLKMHEEIGNKDGAVSSLVAIGGVYHEKKDHAKAILYLTRAMQASQEMGNPLNTALCLSNIGEEYVAVKKYKEAEECFKKALVIEEQIKDQESIAMNHIGLGKIYLETGRTKESIEHLVTSLDIAMAIGNKRRIVEASEELAKVHERIGDERAANRFLRQYIQYKDSLFNEESHKKAEEIEFDLILDKKQKEIALLEKDKSIQQSENEKQRLFTFGLTLGIVLLMLVVLVLYKGRQKEKKSKELIMEQKLEIEKQAQSLEELNALKDTTFSVLSHDLRSPVASLTNVMTLMEQDMISQEEFGKLQHNLSSQLKALSHLLDNLLYWAKSHIRAGDQVITDNCSAKELVDQSFGLLGQTAAGKQITLEADVDSGLMLLVDKNQIDIVLRNLISNAIKFTQPGGKVNVSAKREQQQVVFSISDSGIGMDSKQLEGLFGNHPQPSSYGTSGEKGTGLGLMLCKEFVEKNGGHIWASSEKGKGSHFFFTLPAA